MESFKSKVNGCLYGTVIGTQLGLQYGSKSISFEDKVKKAFEGKLEFGEKPVHQHNNKWIDSIECLPASLAKTYIKKKGRVTPEDWAAELVNDDGITENKSFWLMDFYTTIELLREGMNPRLTGFGAMPCGNASVAMIPLGIYYAGDPEGAYFDGIELGSVVQRSPGTEWAALAAVAVAEALKPGATPASVIEVTLEIAQKYNKDVFYEINHIVRQARNHTTESYIPYYISNNQQDSWYGGNPIGNVLGLLQVYGNEAEKLMSISALGAFPHIYTAIAGAIIGALYGEEALPTNLREAVGKQVEPLLPMVHVTKNKIFKESIIVKEIEMLGNQLVKDGKSLMYDKILGCLLASSIGNAMGSVVEGQQYQVIDKKYPEHVTTVLEPSRLESEDDNQMAMLLVETYIDRKGLPVSARDFGETWKKRLNRDHFFYCMKNSYDLIREGMDARIAGHWNVVTGSTVMCMEPVGLYHLCDPENAYMDAISISYMYQRGLDVTTAAILAASTAEALKPGATVDSVLQATLNYAPKKKMMTFDKREIDTPYDFISRCLDVAGKYSDVFEAREELYEKCLYYHMIDPLELLGLTYAMFKIANGDVRISAIGGTNIGRDSDTIAGRGAMLSGALRGAGNVPEEWIRLFKSQSLDRIKTSADRITSLITDNKLQYMRQRQNII